MIEICFICTGNTCRSVMAERIAKKMAKKAGIKDVKFSSAGIYATGAQISPNAVATLKTLGYDSRSRKSVKFKKPKKGVVYVAVTPDHKRYIGAERCISFAELAGEVADPYGQSLNVYISAAHRIEENVEALLKKIKTLRGEK